MKRREHLTTCAAFAMTVAAAAPTQSAGAPSAWTIASVNTQLQVSINALLLPLTRGAFKSPRGAIVLDFDRPSRSSIEIAADVNSIEVSDPSIRSFVLGESVFAAARFPTIGFRSTSIAKLDDVRARVIGDLTLRGVTRVIALELALEPDSGKPGGIGGFVARGQLNRLEFGIAAGYPLVTSQVDLLLNSGKTPR